MASISPLLDPHEDSRPASLHAERTILGAMLVEPLAIDGTIASGGIAKDIVKFFAASRTPVNPTK